MSFNKRYLPELSDLVRIRENYPSDGEFLSAYLGKTDALIGSPESFKYVQEMIKKIEDDGKRMGE